MEKKKERWGWFSESAAKKRGNTLYEIEGKTEPQKVTIVTKSKYDNNYCKGSEAAKDAKLVGKVKKCIKYNSRIGLDLQARSNMEENCFGGGGGGDYDLRGP